MSNSNIVYINNGCSHTTHDAWQDIFLAYFQRNPFSCDKCNNTFDFDGIRKYLSNKSLLQLALLNLLGLGFRIRSEKLIPDTILSLNTTDLGIPENARIVDVTCIANCDGGLRPLYEPPHALNHQRSPKIFVFHPLKIKNACKETKIAISIVWVNDPQQDILYQAYKNYISEDYNYAVVPLNTYLETIFRIYFKKKVKNSKIQRYKHETFLRQFYSKHIALKFNEIDNKMVDNVISHAINLSSARDIDGHTNEENRNALISPHISNWFTAVILLGFLISHINKN